MELGYEQPEPLAKRELPLRTETLFLSVTQLRMVRLFCLRLDIWNRSNVMHPVPAQSTTILFLLFTLKRISLLKRKTCTIIKLKSYSECSYFCLRLQSTKLWCMTSLLSDWYTAADLVEYTKLLGITMVALELQRLLRKTNAEQQKEEKAAFSVSCLITHWFLCLR